ncbi:hypothetical protein [Nonomuraea rubra]|uniref:hypothetical protein n=1 Tax=Nonomuraea rubra TaxID=46180 RepID=UPI0033C0D683
MRLVAGGNPRDAGTFTGSLAGNGYIASGGGGQLSEIVMRHPPACVDECDGVHNGLSNVVETLHGLLALLVPPAIQALQITRQIVLALIPVKGLGPSEADHCGYVQLIIGWSYPCDSRIGSLPARKKGSGITVHFQRTSKVELVANLFRHLAPPQRLLRLGVTVRA